MSRAKAVFIPPAELVVVARSSYSIQNPYGTCETIRGCHNRDKGTAENERLRDLKFIFSYPKNERLIFLGGRNAAQEEISTMRVG